MLPLLPGNYYVARRWGRSRCYKAIGWSVEGRRVARMCDMTNVVMLAMLFRQSFIERWSREITLDLRPYDKKRNALVDLLLGRPRLQLFDSAENARRELRRQQRLPSTTESIARAMFQWMRRQPWWLFVTFVVLSSPLSIIFAPSILVEELMEPRRLEDRY